MADESTPPYVKDEYTKDEDVKPEEIDAEDGNDEVRLRSSLQRIALDSSLANGASQDARKT